MSDVMINVHYDDSTSSRPQAGKQGRVRKNRFYRRKMQNLERKGYVDFKHKYNNRTGQFRHDRAAPHPNGAFRSQPSFPTSTSNRSLPPPSSTAGASHCSSKPSTSTQGPTHTTATTSTSTTHRPGASSSYKQTSTGVPTKYIAIDCEMVGTGPKGRISQLARCSIVSYEGDVVYDKFIKPSALVTDYRTRWSGIRYSDLANATPFSEARKEILKLLMGKVVVGHAVHNDFKVLGYSHPAAFTRDTSRIPLLNAKAGFAENECASLKRLTKAIFNRDIQTGKKGHSSVEDAKATMELYKVVEVEWERELASRSQAS